jgi:hypothetical protein
MKKKYLLLIGIALALPAAQALAQRAAGPMAGTSGTSYGIEGTAHDFSTQSWELPANHGRNDTCNTCHTPHSSNPDQSIPLWAHQTTTTSFTPFSSPSLQATVGQPTGVSLACLSCHDGTVAVNQAFSSTSGTGSTTGGTPVNIASFSSSYVIGGGGVLTYNHPISFAYNDALVALDPFLNSPEAALPNFIPTQGPGYWNPNWTISQAMLVGGRMECSSCHDVHAQVGNAASGGLLIKVSGVDSAGRGGLLCRTCHIK